MQSCLGCLVLLALGFLAFGVIIVFLETFWPIVIVIIICWLIVAGWNKLGSQK